VKRAWIRRLGTTSLNPPGAFRWHSASRPAKTVETMPGGLMAQSSSERWNVLTLLM
jgi:hypothetical protein